MSTLGNSVDQKEDFVTVSNDGNLGIGTSTPSKKLDIVGDINFTGNLYNNNQLVGSSVAFGLNNNNGVLIDSSSITQNDYARFTSNGLEGRNYSEVKIDLSLDNVDNTSDSNKPVSTAQQSALDIKANLNSPTFTGIPLAPTASSSVNNTQIATTAFVHTKINEVIDGAPAAVFK